MGEVAACAKALHKVTLAGDLRVLLRHLGHESVSLVGTDIAMMVAFTYALRRPDDVRHLVLGDGLLPGSASRRR